MHAALIGVFFQQLPIFVNELYHRVVVVPVGGMCSQRIEFFFWKSKYFTYLPENGTVLKLHIGATKSYMIPSVTVKNVLQNSVALLPTPINVKIWWRLAVQIQKTFKIQVKLQWANVGNPQTVSYDAVGATTPPYVHKTHAVAVTNDVPGYQKVTAEG